MSDSLSGPSFSFRASVVSSKNLLFFFIILIHSLFVPFFFHSGLNYLNYVLLFILIFSNLFFLKILFKRPAHIDTDSISKTDLFFIVSLLFISMWVSFSKIHLSSIWLDEYWEGYRIIDQIDFVSNAASMQQPPLTFYWRSIGLLIGGKTEVGLRLGSVFGFVFFIQVMFLLIKNISKNSVFSFFSSLLLCFHPILVLYSVEARPYSISLFYGALTLYFLTDYLLFDKKFSLFDELPLTFFTFFWLISIGMQPFIAILLLLVFSLAIGYFKKEAKWWNLSKYLIFGILLFIPFQIEIYSQSVRYFSPSQFYDGDNNLPTMISNTFLSLFSFNIFYYIISIQIIFVCALSFFNAPNRKAIFGLVVFAFLYFFLTLLIFYFTIQLKFSYRYMLTMLPIVHFIFCIATWSIYDFRYASRKIIYFVILTSVVLFTFLNVPLPIRPKIDWRDLYANLNTRMNSESKIFTFQFFKQILGRQSGFIAPEYYMKNEIMLMSSFEKGFSEKKKANDLIFEALSHTQKNDIFFIVFKNKYNLALLSKITFENIEKIQAKSFVIFHSKKPIFLHEMAEQFYTALTTESNHPEIQSLALEMQYLISIFQKNCSKAYPTLLEYTFSSSITGLNLNERLAQHYKLFSENCE